MTDLVRARVAEVIGRRVAARQREIVDAHGVITEVNAAQGWYGIVPDADKDVRYAPDKLPEEFRKDGLRVIFSGRVGRIDPNVRAWGAPLALTKIERE